MTEKTPALSKSQLAAEDALQKAEELHDETLREMVVPHVPKAIQTLANFSEGKAAAKGLKDPPPSVTYNASKTLIELAHGKPETRDPQTADSGTKVVVLIKESSGNIRDVTGGIVEAAEGMTEGERILNELEEATGARQTVKKKYALDVPHEEIAD